MLVRIMYVLIFCHSKQYNSYDFLDNFEDSNNTGPSIIEHAFSVNAKEVNSLEKIQYYIYIPTFLGIF